MLFDKNDLDCASLGAQLDIYRGVERCISLNNPGLTVNLDTLVVSACKDLYGGSAELISLPANETELWDYLKTLVSAYVHYDKFLEVEKNSRNPHMLSI